MNICELCQLSSPSGCAKLDNESCLKDIFKLLKRNVTNGDMIKALFPNAEFDNAMPFTDGRWEIMNLDTENSTRAIYKPTQLRTYADWWNAPYERR